MALQRKERIAVVGERNVGRNENYYNALESVGAMPVSCNPHTLDASLQTADGILLIGGCDINPALYGEVNTASRDIDNDRDCLEHSVLTAAIAYKKPVLGICRGLQMINVHFGGSLVQNVSNCVIHERIGEEDKIHQTVLERNSFLHTLYGTEHIVVNSAHHQAVKQLGAHLRVIQHSMDGLVEAVEHESLPIIAVQWHPERMCLACARPDTVDGLPVFRYFLTLA